MKKVLLGALTGIGLATLTAMPALAEPVYNPPVNQVKMQKTQVPGYYRMMVGNNEVTAIYDGYGNLDASLMTDYTKFTKEELDKMIDDAYVPRTELGGMEGTIIAYLVNTGDHLILIDSGKGETKAPIFLDEQGRLLDNMKAAGYTPDQVDIILPTHMHSDHINGITYKGKRVFKNATVYVPKEEKAFWIDTPVDALPKEVQPYVELAHYAMDPYIKADKVKYYTSGQEVFSNVKSLPLFGHTPGHSGFEFTSNGEKILFWGDIIHCGPVQLKHPEVAIEFDANADAARVTRDKMLKQVVKDKTLVASPHLPFPGFGHIEASDDGQGYKWIPVTYHPLEKH
ncbi:MAG: MBL fold metallo-hydrolase [Veillonella sp.]|mgnify:FL=1|uniref:MBL fold metallo-hydrolase n=1 Tax=Veillonella caviae TaxID=248316 RepID=UPI000F8DE781|nr:MBL fold metallo-hydrolase [Veillonella caviae]MCF0158657.1 MBL fold metallo-hydrolase [Veillonella sp.]